MLPVPLVCVCEISVGPKFVTNVLLLTMESTLKIFPNVPSGNTVVVIPMKAEPPPT